MATTTVAGLYPEVKEKAAVETSQLEIYMSARRTLDARNRTVIRQRNWLIGMNAGLVVVLVVMAGALLRMSGESRLTPYVIQTDGAGRILDAKVLTPKFAANDFTSARVVEAQVDQWVEDWRYVTSDIYAQHNIALKVFSMVAPHSEASTWLMNWFRANDPVNRSKSVRVDAHVINTVPQSFNSYEVYWRETETNLADLTSHETRWRAVVHVSVDPPKNEEQAARNRFGIWVTSISQPSQER